MTNENIKFLVVDDSEYFRKLTASYLTEEGYTVAVNTGNPKDVIPMLEKIPCDIAIVDLVMPEISGIELAKEIKLKYADSISIIMISSLKQENIVLESIIAGASEFMYKPFTKEMLISVIEKIRS